VLGLLTSVIDQTWEGVEGGKVSQSEVDWAMKLKIRDEMLKSAV